MTLRSIEYGIGWSNLIINKIVKHMSKETRENYINRLRKKLELYEFQKRKKIDPPHPRSKKMVKKGEEYNFDNPLDLADFIIEGLHFNYNAETSNRTKKNILKNL